MNEADETTELSAQDEQDLALLDAMSMPLEHTVLEMWEATLGDIETMAETRIAPGYANRQLQRWPKLEPAQLPLYYKLFHDYLKDYREVVAEQIRLHPDAKSNTAAEGEPKQDGVANRAIYADIMFGWFVTTAKQEEAWDANDSHMYVRLAAIHEAQLFVTGPQGIMQLLNQPSVGFQWSDEDQAALQQRVIDSVTEESGE
jgi:hypothetical protein